MLTGLLEDNNSDAVRAGAAFALGVAASSNEPFIVELRQRGGDDVMIHFVEVRHLLHWHGLVLAPVLCAVPRVCCRVEQMRLFSKNLIRSTLRNRRC